MEAVHDKGEAVKASDEQLGSIFDGQLRYEIPIFQRPYVWAEEKNWAPLWEDLRHAAELVAVDAYGQDDDGPAPHEQFLGAVVTQPRRPVPGRVPLRQVIDGQQRMTTLQVFLACAWRVAAGIGAVGAVTSFELLVRNRVADDTDHPEDRYKVVPLPGDAKAFEWAVRSPSDGGLAPDTEHLLVKAEDYFTRELTAWVGSDGEGGRRLENLHFALLERIKVVSVFLDARDDPQVIFEALNYKGVPLDAADLVKNLLFQRLTAQGDRAQEVRLHEDYWRPLDGRRWRAKVTTGRIERARVDTLLAYWLSGARADLVSVEHLYADFKAWLSATEPTPRAADVIIDLRAWADTMDELLDREMTDPVRQVLDRFEATQTTTAWPVLLYLHATEGVPVEQAVLGAAALDSYTMRRAMCRMTGKDYNRAYGALLHALAQSDPQVAGQTVVDFLAAQTADSRVWPTDHQFVDALLVDDIYNSVTRARLRSLLVGLDTAMLTSRSEPDPPRKAASNLTIEHVLPQAWEKYWPLPANVDSLEAGAERNRHVHQLGNLTLATGSLNSEMREGPWSVKRHALQTHSLVRLTTGSILTYPQGLKGYTTDSWTSAWDETRIGTRTMYLIRMAIHVWPRPAEPDLESE